MVLDLNHMNSGCKYFSLHLLYLYRHNAAGYIYIIFNDTFNLIQITFMEHLVLLNKLFSVFL